MSQNPIPQHSHSPSRFRNPFLRFWDFFFRREKLFFTFDNTGVCSVCKADIAVHWAYYHGGLKAVYFITGVLIVALGAVLIVSAGIPSVLYKLYLLISMLLWDRVIRCAVLAFFPWRTYTASKFNVEKQCEAAKKELWEQRSWLFMGALVCSILIAVFFG